MRSRLCGQWGHGQVSTYLTPHSKLRNSSHNHVTRMPCNDCEDSPGRLGTSMVYVSRDSTTDTLKRNFTSGASETHMMQSRKSRKHRMTTCLTNLSFVIKAIRTVREPKVVWQPDGVASEYRYVLISCLGTRHDCILRLSRTAHLSASMTKVASRTILDHSYL